METDKKKIFPRIRCFKNRQCYHIAIFILGNLEKNEDAGKLAPKEEDNMKFQKDELKALQNTPDPHKPATKMISSEGDSLTVSMKRSKFAIKASTSSLSLFVPRKLKNGVNLEHLQATMIDGVFKRDDSFSWTF